MVGMEFEIRHLKLVETIATEGTMTRAAARLYMTQSALSHQLAGLEEALGISLFRRVPRGMILTDRKSTRLNSSHRSLSRMPSSA